MKYKLLFKAGDPPFEVGDLVTSGYHQDDKNIVRRVVSVKRGNVSSGWVVSADKGDPCPCCGRRAFKELKRLDSAWFKKVEK